MNISPIYLVVGPPAVGKSTTSRALAAHFPKSIHIPVDDLRVMVVSGLLLPNPEWSNALAQQVSLARASAIHMALRYRSAGFAVVIDDFWDADHLADYRDLFDQPDTHKVVLMPDQAIAHQRNQQRAGNDQERGYIDEGIRIVYQELLSVAPGLDRQGWLIVDSSAIDVAETVANILKQTLYP